METKKIEDVTYVEVHEIEKYGSHYSEEKFWKKITRIAKKAGATVLRPVFQLYYMLQSNEVPIKHKAYIVGALGYFILPFDIIPESILPLIGFADDIAVMAFVLKIVEESMTAEIKEMADTKVAQLLGTTKLD